MSKMTARIVRSPRGVPCRVRADNRDRAELFRSPPPNAEARPGVGAGFCSSWTARSRRRVSASRPGRGPASPWPSQARGHRSLGGPDGLRRRRLRGGLDGRGLGRGNLGAEAFGAAAFGAAEPSVQRPSVQRPSVLRPWTRRPSEPRPSRPASARMPATDARPPWRWRAARLQRESSGRRRAREPGLRSPRCSRRTRARDARSIMHAVDLLSVPGPTMGAHG